MASAVFLRLLKNESVFRPFFSVERVKFEMAVLKQRKIDGGVAYSRTNGQVNISS